MKSYTLTLAISFCLFKLSISQEVVSENLGDSSIESFQKYSYLLIQYPKINSIDERLKVHHGTGFFLKVKKKLFLVSNYHVITGADGLTLTFKNSYDSIKIPYDDVNGKQDYFTIDLRQVNSSRRILSFKQYPDVFLIQISTLPKNAKIYAFDDMLFERPKTADRKNAFSYQYGLAPGNSIELQISKLQREYNFVPAYTSGVFFDQRSNEPTEEPFMIRREALVRVYNLAPLQKILKGLVAKWPRSGASDPGLFDSSVSPILVFRDIFVKKDSLDNSVFRSGLTFISPLSNVSSHFLIEDVLTFRLFNYLLTGNNILRPFHRGVFSPLREKKTIYVDDNFYLGNMIDYSVYNPNLYLGNLVNDLQYLNKPCALYTRLSPATYQGASGSPIFYACEKLSSDRTEKWFEFAGIQSSVDVRLDISVIVQPSALISIIKSGKNIDGNRIMKN